MFCMKKSQQIQQFQSYTSSALHLYHSVYSYLPPLVLEWCSAIAKFQTGGNSNKKYWPWYFNTFIVACVIGFGSCVDVVIHPKEAGNSLSIVAFGLGSVSLLYWASAAVVIWNVDDIVSGIGYLNAICQHRGTFYICIIFISKYPTIQIWR